MNRRRRRLIYIAIAIILIALCIAAFDVRLKTVKHTIDIPQSDGTVRIALVTDLHSCYYGKGQQRLLDAIDKQQPDIVLLGGDIVDDGKPFDNAEIFLEAVSQKYPCYYVTGNHEFWSRRITDIIDFMHSCGITVLRGTGEALEINGQTFNLCGIDDPDIEVYDPRSVHISDQLAAANEMCKNGNYTILLAHRPELIETYAKHDFNLVLSGHAHGGQWRIPGILNGLYSPNQGLFPRYTGGKYTVDDCTMIVSRGLARESTRVPRIFNRPELIIVELS